MTMRTTTAVEKYARIAVGMSRQFRYSQDAVTTLPTSRTVPMTSTGQNAAEKIVVSPSIEYQADTAEITRPVTSASSLCTSAPCDGEDYVQLFLQDFSTSRPVNPFLVGSLQ